MAEKRQHKRIKKRIQVLYGEEDFELRAFARDISVGGLFLEVHRLPDLGTRLHLHVMDPKRDFYVEAEVVRQRRVEVRMRAIEKEGVGLRFLTPAELIAAAVPQAERVRETNTVTCADSTALRSLLSEQIYSRILVVPVDEPAPAAGTIVEFVIEMEFGDSEPVEGTGRVVQILGMPGEERKAVLEIQDAGNIRAKLEAI